MFFFCYINELQNFQVSEDPFLPIRFFHIISWHIIWPEFFTIIKRITLYFIIHSFYAHQFYLFLFEYSHLFIFLVLRLITKMLWLWMQCRSVIFFWLFWFVWWWRLSRYTIEFFTDVLLCSSKNYFVL